MPFQISLQPGGQQFQAEPDQTILDAALAAGLLLPYGCRDGACGACKGKVIAGTVDHGGVSGAVLTDEERAAGLALFCRATARSDLVLEARTVARTGDIPVKKLPCRVQKLERAADDVMILDLKLPATEQFQFHAGQYIDILLADGGRRSFSIANAPHDAGHLELHVRRVPGGRFTSHVFEGMKERDILRLEGPLGSFFLREDSGKPIVLVAGGTGFAPIKSIVEHARHIGLDRPMTLYWGSRDRAGLYMDGLARGWEGALPGFRYIPVLSDPSADDAWDGRRGLVHRAVMEDLPDLSGHEVYACGAPAMITAARMDFASGCGLPDTAFFADSFTYSNK
ncbi:CDP-6-deoxy-delta-3,4-glucoseen reductase [Pseudothauera rhizosphaerae]|uniref:CDP-6-deoxy-delta-3,4-glucoseen reductase n=1 Tax=Pseudothauera rhizosphaerae TaxID=2565932 RepID=A0A4S4ANR9_9RHOO|nr:CDP-6-deoxy-delta-3,4-glucoseen reductase [Pseudothauera rhizosphaerae]THF61295.1 CDP-6-deoxy-delta-3,4-glucoseen reductase [Pseudothauera rhizosphaerae]